MLTNSVVVATNWRIQAHKQEDYNAEKNDKLGMIAREVKCIVLKLCQRSYAELRFIGSFGLLSALGTLSAIRLLSALRPLGSLGPLCPINLLNRSSSFRLCVLGTLLGRSVF